MNNMNGIDVFQHGTLIEVNVSFWSGAKMLTPEDLGLKADQVVDAFKLGKKYLVPAEVIAKFRAVENRARRCVEINSFEFPFGHARFLPKNVFYEVIEELKGYQAEYMALAKDLVDNYSKYREEMVPVYKQAAEQAFMTQLPSTIEFNIEDLEAKKVQFVQEFMYKLAAFYPPVETLPSKFSLTWNVFEMAMPDLVQTDGTATAEELKKAEIATAEYRAQAQAKIGQFLDSVVGTLRTETLELCSRVAGNIQEGKVINAKTLKHLGEFVDKFRSMNFMGDKTVEDQLSALKADLLDKHSTEQIKDDKELQVELGRRLNMIVEAAESTTDINSVTGEYRRKIQMDPVEIVDTESLSVASGGY